MLVDEFRITNHIKTIISDVQTAKNVWKINN